VRGRPISFSPPAVKVTAELEWVLLAAFGSEPQTPSRSLDTALVVTMARTFDLVPRIASRVGPRALESILGPGAARDLLEEALVALARGEQLHQLSRLMDRTAASAGIPIAFLKFSALVLGGHVSTAQRRACDVDVLAPDAELPRLVKALLKDGWEESQLPGYEHHLPPILHPRLGAAELHRHIVGVDVAARGRFATYEDLEAAGLLVPAPGLSSVGRIPSRELLIAHALAHCLAQHGLAPQAYPVFRLVGDLIDIGASVEEAGTIERITGRLSPYLTAGHVEGAIHLASRLHAGDRSLFSPAAADSQEGSLLRHFVAGMLDTAYRDSLRLAELAFSPSERLSLFAAVARVAHALFPGREALDRVYGPATGFWSRATFRTRRVVEMACRLPGYVWAVARRRRHLLRG
jgi:hypothetical protein